jgi:hypothetical protein
MHTFQETESLYKHFAAAAGPTSGMAMASTAHATVLAVVHAQVR